jgi:hypothetical protein
MAKRKNRLVTAREPNGRIQRSVERELSPTEARRLRDAAFRGLRDAEWGTELGRMCLEGAITWTMYLAGKRWREQAETYRRAIGVFPVRSASLERGSRSTTSDPDSEDGRKQAQREANGAERFFEAHARLITAGPVAESMVRLVCEEDISAASYVERVALWKGLRALVDHYNLTKQEK